MNATMAPPPAHTGWRDKTEQFLSERTAARSTRDVQVAVDAGPPPLGWVQAVSKVEHAEGRITQLLKELEAEQARYLMLQAEVDGVGADEDEDVSPQELERHIASMTSQVNALFKSLDGALGKVVQDADNPLMLMNVHRGLVSRISALHDRYRALQQQYQIDLRQKSSMKNKVSEMFTQNDTKAWEEEEAKECRVDELKLKGYSREVIESIMLDEDIAREKLESLEDIEVSLKELNEMFRDLHALVIEQGTMIDRIDTNVKSATDAMTVSCTELHKARKV